MGNFSWNCCDCHKPILSDGPSIDDYCFKCEEQLAELDGAKQTVYLIDTDGKLIREDDYEGYGVFGGIDAYGWLAHRNIEAIRKWKSIYTNSNDENFKLLVKDSYEEEFIHGEKMKVKYAADRHLGIDLEHAKRKKEFTEIAEMLRDKCGLRPLEKDLYHYAKDLIKNPIKIICSSCLFKDSLSNKNSVDYEDYYASSSAENQGWTHSHDTDVGWVCEECVNW